jgi:DNA-binding response OmpR family regulator
MPTRVLLLFGADTDPGERTRITRSLARAGFELMSEEDPARPDAVLLDLPSLPRERSRLIARAAVARAPLIVTSRDQSNLARQARALGAYAWVARPIETRVLKQRLTSAARAWHEHPSLFGLTVRADGAVSGLTAGPDGSVPPTAPRSRSTR